MSTLKVNTIQDTTGNDALTIDSSGNVTASQGFVPSTQLSHRNLIINGAMQVAQRGTSVTGSTANAYQTVDRWYHIASGATYNSSQESLTVGQTDIPRQFQYFLRFNATTGNNNSGVEQRVENILSIAGETVTLSFYAKGTNPGGGSMQIEFDEYWDGSTQTQNTESFTLTSSWQRFTFTRTLTDPTGKTIGSNSFLGIKVRQPTADTNTDAWTLDITGVQLEVGSVATPFEHRSYGEELARCMRYFQKTKSASGIGYGSGVGVNFICTFTVPMRNSPSVSSEGVIQVSDWAVADYTQSSTSISINFGTNVTTEGIAVSCTNFSGLTNHRPYAQKPNSTNAITFDAEL